ncbi:MAG: hypothetical protein HQ518_28235 [Rhodopirellula sp.]|nr:hypothetical protein [Rhodopirellula sp.]
MRIEFSARAWMLSAATGLVILPSMDVEVRAESQEADSSISETSGEPGKLIERPATREAISTSKPARGLFPSLFSKTKAEPAIQLPPKEPGDTRSEVQRHLDELYRREGRSAPSLDIGQTPSAGLSQSVLTPESSVAEASSGGPIRQVSSNPFKRFFQKITPFHRSKSANDEKPEHVEPLPAAARREQLRLQQTPIAQPIAQPKPDLEPKLIPLTTEGVAARPALPTLDMLVPPPPAPPEVANAAEPDEQSAPVEAAVADVTSSAKDAAQQLPEFLPAVELPEGTAPQILATELSDEPISSKAKTVLALPEPDELLGNPFPELSESEADGKPAEVKPVVVVNKADDKKTEAGNPFNGLKLDVESAADAAKADIVQQTAADSVSLPKLPDLPAPAELAAPDNAVPADKLPEITPAEKPVVKATASSGAHNDKMKLIAERSELTGLKGFCPVALRDSRELKDARPQFQARFNGKIYNLSSAEAKEKFESNPEDYAPAAGGQDVVLAANGGVDREGSLDRAVWYRNRLYLFSSKNSHEEFVASPSKFSVDIADQE